MGSLSIISLKRLVAEDKLDRAVDELLSALEQKMVLSEQKEKLSQIYNDMILISSRIKAIQKTEQAAIERADYVDIQKNKVKAHFLELIDDHNQYLKSLLQDMVSAPQLVDTQRITAPAASARQTKIILDRHFTYMLTSFCTEQLQINEDAIANRYRELFEALSYCLLFFDKILIEQQHVSSISWNLAPEEADAFGRIFESFSFGDLSLNPYEKILLQEMINQDLNNPAYKRVLDEYYSAKPIKPSNYSEIVKYINNCIFYSEKHNTSICPLSNRVPLYHFKFTENNRFFTANNTKTFLNKSIEILIPEIRFSSLKDLLAIRENKRFKDFREKIWQLSINHLLDSKPDSIVHTISKNFAEANFELILELQPEQVRKARLSATGNTALPINKGINLPPSLEQDFSSKKFNWLFFIYDIKANYL